MNQSLFRGLFDTENATIISLSDFMLCLAVSLLIGLALALAFLYHSRCTQSFAVTLALLPAVVCVVILMVNGNIGTGVAVAGTFSLVRFRSAPGTAKEITMVFLAMGCGLLTGMGYLGYAFLFTLLMCTLCILYNCLGFGFPKKAGLYKTLHITIPEDLDYTGVFDEILQQYTTSCELIQVKTTNMGSMFRLTYQLTLRSQNVEKQLIDELRCRNGNLEITVSRQENSTAEL